MNFYADRQRLLKEVQEEFIMTYPFLKIEFFKKEATSPEEKISGEEMARMGAKGFLRDRIGITDDMKVGELERALEEQAGLPAQVLRKSGNLWMETRMTRHWTLRQQNDHGADIASGFF